MSLLLPLQPDDLPRRVGQEHAALCKTAGDAALSPVLTGRFYVSKSGWGLLSVPNSLARGLFEASQEPGIELPPGPGDPPGLFNAHVSVFRKEEIEQLGGPDRLKERGEVFCYNLGPVKSVVPMGWSEMSRCWFVEIHSPELKALRKSYGLSPLPMKGDMELPFHITFAVRRKGILQPNALSKAGTLLTLAELDHDKEGKKAEFAQQALATTPPHWNPGLGVFGNMLQHVGRIGERTDRLISEQHSMDDFLSQDPAYRDQRTLNAMHGHPNVNPSFGDRAMAALPGMPFFKASATLAALKQIKEHSDRKQYRQKHHMLRHLLQTEPDDWQLGEDAGMATAKHKSGFRFHLPHAVVPPS